jgi:hypothetical protein
MNLEIPPPPGKAITTEALQVRSCCNAHHESMSLNVRQRHIHVYASHCWCKTRKSALQAQTQLSNLFCNDTHGLWSLLSLERTLLAKRQTQVTWLASWHKRIFSAWQAAAAHRAHRPDLASQSISHFLFAPCLLSSYKTVPATPHNYATTRNMKFYLRFFAVFFRRRFWEALCRFFGLETFMSQRTTYTKESIPNIPAAFVRPYSNPCAIDAKPTKQYTCTSNIHKTTQRYNVLLFAPSFAFPLLSEDWSGRRSPVIFLIVKEQIPQFGNIQTRLHFFETANSAQVLLFFLLALFLLKTKRAMISPKQNTKTITKCTISRKFSQIILLRRLAAWSCQQNMFYATTNPTQD